MSELGNHIHRGKKHCNAAGTKEGRWMGLVFCWALNSITRAPSAKTPKMSFGKHCQDHWGYIENRDSSCLELAGGDEIGKASSRGQNITGHNVKKIVSREALETAGFCSLTKQWSLKAGRGLSHWEKRTMLFHSQEQSIKMRDREAAFFMKATHQGCFFPGHVTESILDGWVACLRRPPDMKSLCKHSLSCSPTCQ